MISIIICSKYPALSVALVDNIEATIGAEYEIIHIDNSQGKYSIFEAYNEGINRSKGENLCFMHEDVVFHSDNWGCVVNRLLNQKDVGAIGIAGGCVVPKRMDWRFSNYHWGCLDLIQGCNTIEENPHYYTFRNSHIPKLLLNRKQLPVAVLDGVWMAMPKELFKSICFDTETYSGFHLYDSDICMQINKLGKNIYVTREILLEHKSEGLFTQTFRENQQAFARKWEAMLPVIKALPVMPEEVDTDNDEAETEFETRMLKDSIVMSITTILRQKKEGKPCRELTSKELNIISQSQFYYCKSIIKNKQHSTKEALKLLKIYIKDPYQKRKGKLVMKFLWYRILGFRPQFRHIFRKKYNYKR